MRYAKALIAVTLFAGGALVAKPQDVRASGGTWYCGLLINYNLGYPSGMPAHSDANPGGTFVGQLNPWGTHTDQVEGYFQTHPGHATCGN